MLRDVLMILFVTCSTLGSQVLLKLAVREVSERGQVPHGVAWLLAMLTSTPVLTAVVIQGVGFVVWLVVISRMKLGVAFALSGAFFYLLMAVVSWLIYGERLMLWQWIGILLISVGVLLLSLTGAQA